ncbi:MAG: alpha/beta hydrolase [Candidatus Promineifilaceae bacterium]|jgi:pimeloyl-ACP methyl ester carboxylesterase
MSAPVLPGITPKMIQTPRINTHVLLYGPEDGIPVVFIHGNFSASTFWEEIMLAMPEGYFAVAPDLRGYGDTEDLIIDGARGARDWSDDLKALSDIFGDRPAHLVGWSLGGGVAMQFLLDYPELVSSLTLVSPISPYGFGGTKGLNGEPCYDDFAGSGGGVVNPDFIQRIKEGDRSADDPNSPRNVISTFYYKAPFQASREEDFLTAALLEKVGEDRYPGDLNPSENWPNVAPGQYGPINATSPRFYNTSAIADSEHKPPILWIRGDSDQIVSDLSMFDMGALGQLGFVPGWPGDEIYPPQPMVSQMKAVLEQYAANGGTYEEVVVVDAAHSPHIEKPEVFNQAFHALLEQAK